MGNYRFNFSIGVWGKNKFSLTAKDTSTDSTADTYRNSSTVKNKAKYVVDLDGDGAFKPNYYGVTHYANGEKSTTSYGAWMTMDKGTANNRVVATSELCCATP